MTLKAFIERIPQSHRSNVSDATLKLWHMIFTYITKQGQTDRFDLSLIKLISGSNGIFISEATVQRHLKRMCEIGLLEGHRMIAKPDIFGRFFKGLTTNYGPPAGAFMRYTLPGMIPTLENRKRKP